MLRVIEERREEKMYKATKSVQAYTRQAKHVYESNNECTIDLSDKSTNQALIYHVYVEKTAREREER